MLVIVRVAPLARLPSEQGYAVTQSPVFDTNVRPVGVGSATLTARAGAGPLFVTVIV